MCRPRLVLAILAVLLGTASARAQFDPKSVNYGRSFTADYSSLDTNARAAPFGRALNQPANKIGLLLAGAPDNAWESGLGAKKYAPIDGSSLLGAVAGPGNESMMANASAPFIVLGDGGSATPANAEPTTEITNPVDIDFAPQFGYFDEADEGNSRTVSYDPAISTMGFHSILVSDPDTARLIKKIRTTILPMLFVASCLSLFYVRWRVNERRKLSLLFTLSMSDRFFDE